MGLFTGFFKVFSEECAACGGSCEYSKKEEKNYIGIGNETKLICKSCADWFEKVDSLRKKYEEESRR